MAHYQHIKLYAGIGSRKTPHHVQEEMFCLSTIVERNNWLLRSGGALGADVSSEAGVTDDRNKEIFLPWKGYNDSSSRLYTIHDEDYDSVDLYHPKSSATWSMGIKSLMARNYQIMVGRYRKRRMVNVVICWTPCGCESDATRTTETGGTGQAISIADSLGIPVLNLANLGRFEEALAVLST